MTKSELFDLISGLLDKGSDAKTVLAGIAEINVTPVIADSVTEITTACKGFKWNDKVKTTAVLSSVLGDLGVDVLGVEPKKVDAPKSVARDTDKSSKTAKAKSSKVEMSDDDILALDELETQIKAQIEIASKAWYEVGRLLIEAKALHGTIASFTKWTEENVKIKKRQAYKLMKAYETFKDEEWSYGLAGRVLDVLTNAKASVVAKVEAKVNNGEQVTRKDVEKIKQEESGQVETDAVLASNAEREAGEANPLTKDVSFNVQESDLDESSETTALLTRIKQLEDALKQAEIELNKMKKPGAQKVKGLPQFSSKLPALVLGLSEVDAKDDAKVRANYREMVAIWNKGTNLQAYTALTSAKDLLVA